jgi:Uma2 family endonuclease
LLLFGEAEVHGERTLPFLVGAAWYAFDMSDRSEKKRRATYQDVLDAPEHVVAEIINGDLRLSPRPAAPHSAVASAVGGELYGPFDCGRGGPGGWLFLDEPELHFGDDIVVPDIAGWRRERMSVVPDVAFFTLAPDWICEVLSVSTEKMDRIEKMPIYAAAGIGHAWLVSPKRRTLEVFRLVAGQWVTIGLYKDTDRARIEPFDAIEIELARFWRNSPLPSRAQEQPGHYEYEPY